MDRCYHPESFAGGQHRVEYLFALHEKLTASLLAPAKSRPRGAEDASGVIRGPQPSGVFRQSRKVPFWSAYFIGPAVGAGSSPTQGQACKALRA